MAIVLFNKKIALDSISQFSTDNATMTGIVRLKAADVPEGVSVGGRVIYPRSATRIVVYNDHEYVVVTYDDLDGKI